jgi:phosphoribosylanthranilate isomerase
MPSKIKICGITCPEDAQEAANAGASFVGCIFVDSSPRSITPAQAIEITAALGTACQTVGVFQDTDLSTILAVVEQSNLDLVQLHGHETPETCAQISKPTIKVFSLDFAPEFDIRFLIEPYLNVCDYIMFDKLKGSTDPDWLAKAINVIRTVEADLPPYFLAGGLSVNNLSAVLTSLHPFCLDVSSSLESSAGRKDASVMKAFCRQVTFSDSLAAIDSHPIIGG